MPARWRRALDRGARTRRKRATASKCSGVAVDITERKAAELRAVEDRNALRHMTRVSMLGQLSASIAHQLNQPLAAILGNAEAARKMLGREQVDLAELREICDDIVADDNRAAEVIRRLGALYRRGDMKTEPFDLNELDSRDARSAARRIADPPCHAASPIWRRRCRPSTAGACNCSRCCSISS